MQKEDKYKYDAICPRYLAAAISPIDYSERRPGNKNNRTAIATGSFQVPVAVNASGNGGVYVFPRNILGSGALAANSFVVNYNGATFNPVTGVPGTGTVLTAGPLFDSTSSIERFIMSTL